MEYSQITWPGCFLFDRDSQWLEILTTLSHKSTALEANFLSSIYFVPQNIWGKDVLPLEEKIKRYSYNQNEKLKKPNRKINLVLKAIKF